MTPKSIFEAIFLFLTIAMCWVGVLGMWRMRTPTAALHFLALPATVGMAALIIATFIKTGNSQAAWKTVMIGFVMLATNSIVAHASARAFRCRDLGHWEPLDGDSIERAHPREVNP